MGYGHLNIDEREGILKMRAKGKRFGRRIHRYDNEQFRDRMRQQYAQADSQKIYARHK